MIPACSDAPTKIERDNPGDPEVFGFVLNPVQDISTSILEDKVIEVEWTDSSLVPTSYVLKKKIRASDNYIALDTLDKDTREFIDESGEITKDTKYEIISLRKQQSGEEVFSEGINSGIDFGDLISSSHTYNADTTAIQINWELETMWSFIAVLSTIDVDVREDIDTVINSNTITTPAFEKDFSERIYQVRLFISEVDLENNNTFKIVDGGYYLGMKFAPEITNVEVINEGKVIINWEDNSGFEDGFQILRSQGSNRNDAGEPEVLATVPPNTTSFTDTLNPFIGYTRGPFGGESLKKSYYGILAYKNDTQTGSFGAELVIDIARPELSIQNSTTSSVTLTWDTDSRDLVKNYILERKINEGSFLTYKTVDPNVNQFTDTQIDTSNTYTYRIKSLTSRYSESVQIGFVGSPVQVDFYDLNGANHIKFSKSENLITASLENDTRIAIVDISAGNVIYSKSVSQSYLSGPSIYEPENLIGYYSTEDGLFTVKDFETDTTVFNLKNPLGRFPGFVTSIFSEQDNSLYMMAGRSELKKFDLTTKQVVFSKPAFGPTYTIREFDLSPNQDSVVFNYRGSFQLIDSEGNSLNFSPSIPSNSDARKVRFSPSGKYISLISGFNEGYIYNAKTKDQIRSLSTEAISFSHNEKYLATIKHKLLNILDFDSMNLKITKAFNSAVLDVKFSSKENILFVSTKYNGIFKFKITDNKTWSQIN